MVSPDGRYVACAESEITLWARGGKDALRGAREARGSITRRWAPTCALPFRGLACASMAFAPDSSTLAALYPDAGMLALWSTAGTRLAVLPPLPRGFRCWRVAFVGDALLVGGVGERSAFFRLLDLRTLRPLAEQEVPVGEPDTRVILARADAPTRTSLCAVVTSYGRLLAALLVRGDTFEPTTLLADDTEARLEDAFVFGCSLSVPLALMLSQRYGRCLVLPDALVREGIDGAAVRASVRHDAPAEPEAVAPGLVDLLGPGR